MLASTGKENVPTNLVTEKNTHNEISKAKLSQPAEKFPNRIGRTMFDQIFNTRAAYRIEKALYDESIVKQAHYLVQTLRETGLQNFGITVDALDQVYGALKSSNTLPEMLLKGKKIPSWSWSGTYEDIVAMEEEISYSSRGLESNTDDADQKAANSAVRNVELDKFMTETEKATKAMNRYKTRQKELYGKKKLFSRSFEADTATSKVSRKQFPPLFHAAMC